VKVRALSVFEGVVYHCWATDTSNPCRPTLEVEAVLRPGDADAAAGALLLPVADYLTMVGDLAVARRCLEDLKAKGRLTDHLGVDHIAFPLWTSVGDPTPPGSTPEGDEG
jgi:hypothetical protein